MHLPWSILVRFLVDIIRTGSSSPSAEDKFYREGLANFTVHDFKKAGFSETLYNNLKEVSYDETTHVSFLTQALTSTYQYYTSMIVSDLRQPPTLHR